MKLKRLASQIVLTVFVSISPAMASPFAANCRYDLDTEGTTTTHYDLWTHSYVPDFHPGTHVHSRMRLDVDLDRGEVKWSSDSGEPSYWNNGYVWKTKDDKRAKSFVVSDGRFVWFGADFFKDNGTIDQTYKYRLDLDSGSFYDSGGTRWDCQKAVNQFQ